MTSTSSLHPCDELSWFLPSLLLILFDSCSFSKLFLILSSWLSVSPLVELSSFVDNFFSFSPENNGLFEDFRFSDELIFDFELLSRFIPTSPDLKNRNHQEKPAENLIQTWALHQTYCLLYYHHDHLPIFQTSCF